jgi:hypothetical protein
MEQLLRGEISDESIGTLRKRLPKKSLMVFVSSTFRDTEFERDILHRKILPDLQKKAQQHEIQVVFYDMRFGVKDENTKDHMTWIPCEEAIRQCFEGSDGLFFLSLQADRYGYRPLPKYLDQEVLLGSIKAKEMTKLENIEEIHNIVRDWYILDENHCPPRFELKTLTVNPDGSVGESYYWEKVLPLLRDALLNSVPFATCSSSSLQMKLCSSIALLRNGRLYLGSIVIKKDATGCKDRSIERN